MKKILIVGMGSSGIAVYHNAIQNGLLPIFLDDEKLGAVNIEPIIPQIDTIVVSPAIKPNHYIFGLAKKYNIPLIGEIEYAYINGLNKKDIIGVTGTNGKTTVCTMLKCVLQEDSLLAGNIGLPATKVIDEPQDKCILELSSFQLMAINKFRPRVACILNIEADHIDYHGSIEEYIRCKLKITQNLKDDDFLIINQDDDNLKNIKTNAQKLSFSVLDRNADCYFDGSSIFVKCNVKLKKIDINIFGDILLHNVKNIMAVLLVCVALNFDLDTAINRLLDYKYAPYRMQYVGQIMGKKVYNDSKSTNVASTISALKSLSNEKNICLILGGRYKKESFKKIFTDFNNIGKVIIYGESKNEIYNDAIGVGFINLVKLNNFEDVVMTAIGQEASCVLFSPACASFDMFSSYLNRGEVFDSIVNAINT